MSPESTRELASGDGWSARRHLVVSERLRRRRRELGLTQMEVVGRLQGLGVNTSNKTVSSLERGAGLDLAKLPEIASALECTITYLVGLTDTPARWEPDDPAPRDGKPPLARSRTIITGQVPSCRGSSARWTCPGRPELE